MKNQDHAAVLYFEFVSKIDASFPFYLYRILISKFLLIIKVNFYNGWGIKLTLYFLTMVKSYCTQNIDLIFRYNINDGKHYQIE